MSFSRVMDDLDTWLYEKENDDEYDLHDLNGDDRHNEDFSVNVDTSEQNLI